MIEDRLTVPSLTAPVSVPLSVTKPLNNVYKSRFLNNVAV
jgi:hypothetical protein